MSKQERNYDNNNKIFRGGLSLTALKIKSAYLRGKDRLFNEFIRKSFPWVTLGCLGLLLVFTMILASISNRPNTSANMGISVTSLASSVAIYLDGQEGANDYTTEVRPNLNGSVSTIETNVRVVVTNAYGYALSLNAATANMIGNNNSANILSPLPTATMQTPAQFTAASCNSWGFATPAVADNFSNAFDASYSVLNNADVASVSSNFAAVPTSSTLVHESNSLDESRPYYFAFCMNRDMPADIYQNTIVWTAVAVDVEPPAAEGTDIQLVTIDNCPTEPTWVTDRRDNNTYLIRLFPNTRAGGGDLCWMMTNLAYAGGGDNTYGDVKSITNSNTLSYTSAFFMIPPGANPTTAPMPPSYSTTGVGQYGNLYNWCAAMGNQQGTSACLNAATPLPDPNVSICPSGWRLPTGDPTTGEFALLNNAINSGSTSSDAGLLNNWFGMYGGSWWNGFFFQGGGGYYWSSTQSNATSARTLDFSPEWVDPADSGGKQGGFSVRCVL